MRAARPRRIMRDKSTDWRDSPAKPSMRRVTRAVRADDLKGVVAITLTLHVNERDAVSLPYLKGCRPVCHFVIKDEI